MYKKLASHTLIYGLSPYLPRILGLFILPIITKDLTTLDYGIYGVILAYVAAIEVLKDLGLNMILYNSFTKMPHQFKWMWRSIYGFLTLWNLGYAVIAAALIYWIVPPEAFKNVWIIIALNLLPIVFFGPTQLIGRVYFQMKEKPMEIAVRTVIFGVLTIVLNLYTISYLKMGYMGWFWSSCIVGLLTNISFWYPVNIKYKLTPIFNFKWKQMKRNLSISLPTVPHYYSSYIIQTSDKAMLSAMNVSTGEIGGYNFAATFGGLFGQLGNALGQAVRPLFNIYYKSNNYRKVREIIFVMQLLFFTLTFLASLWLKEIFSILVKNKELATTYPIAIILIMAVNYRPMYFGSVNVLIYGEKTKKLLYVTFIASLLCVVLNFSLIPVWGIWAAVFSTYISFLYMGYSGYFLKEFKVVDVPFYPLAWLVATLVLTVSAYFAVELTLIFKFAISLGLLFVGVFLTKKLINKRKNG
ncbi:lipopolysaccharide biosynthesis protein [Kaistella pullorum]|uniref:Oligosaccharide flippase family protein n=1 Tax=Kaistella pullorum TaxID=2763074 RepID=A0ABR8WIY7_9FLAO|nr:oligosaccharide flippase family protein [Kaistella pullorum]MBD8017029.1 oligosaccharide flippase family protein [Kaistella pullorum]